MHVFGWLRREAVALVGVAGAALTVLGQLRDAVPMTPWLAYVLDLWRHLTHDLWRPPTAALGVSLHPHVAAALTLSVFLLTIGIGAHVSDRIGGAPPLTGRTMLHRLGEQSWLGLILFAALCMIFLIGHGAGANNRIVLFGSERLGGYAFALPVAVGYIGGSVIGGQAFDRRMLRLGILAGAILAINAGILWLPRLAG